MEIRYVEGDATEPIGTRPLLLVHVCNNGRRWGAGFSGCVSRKWPAAEEFYRTVLPFDDKLSLGMIHLVTVEPEIIIVNMIAAHWVENSHCGYARLSYDALDECLDRVSCISAGLGDIGTGLPVHMPRIGCGLSGGKWEGVEILIIRNLCENDIPVFVYDLPGDER